MSDNNEEKRQVKSTSSAAALAARQKTQTCRGYAEDGSHCRFSVKDGKKCCLKSHKDMENYTEEEFANQQKCTKCSRPRYRFLRLLNMCDNCYKKYNATQCKAKQKSDLTKPCRNKAIRGGRFCRRNHNYMNSYTKDELKNMKQCTTCDRMVRAADIPEGYTTCERDRKIGEENREIERNKEHKICKKIGCTFKAKKNSDFCGTHRIDAFRARAAEMGMKVCKNVNHKCRAMLPQTYGRKTCAKCLEKERLQDKKNYDRLKAAARAEIANGKCKCIDCGMTQPVEEFILKKGELSFKCATCRSALVDYDRNRQRLNTQTNESRVKEIMRCARKRNIHFDIPVDIALAKIVESCYYCGCYETQKNRHDVEYSIMSFDRLDNAKHYTISNVVTCCHTCNIMKRAHTADDFIRFCKNIYDNFGSENEWTVTRRAVTHGQHRSDCRKHKRKTELTSDDIERIVSKKCYYCDSTNETEQIGIDRVDPHIGYIKSNKLVACCKICNVMKLDHTITAFYNHILKVLRFNKSITNEEFAAKFKKPKKQTELEYVSEQLSKIFEYDGKENKNRMDLHKFKYQSRYYIAKIWKGFNVTHFEPELEFCETDEQIDTWLFYRFAISSHYPSDSNNLDTKILIRDKFTRKYVGITSLRATRPHWAANTPYNDICKNESVYNISTCVAIPPFSFNFCGGKLLTMLMFSSEVKNYMAKKNIKLCGLMTYSLHGDSVQYEGIDNFKLCGYTKAIGIDNTKVPKKVYDAMITLMRKRNFNVVADRIANVRKFCSVYGILDATHHGVKRGIYFGAFGGNSLDFLSGKTNELHVDVRSVSSISESWYATHVIPRVKDLVRRNKIMVSYNYDTYYVDKSGYERRKKAKAAVAKKTVEKRDEDENTQRKIIGTWLMHSHEMDNSKIARMLAEEEGIHVDGRKVKAVVFKKNDADDLLIRDAKTDERKDRTKYMRDRHAKKRNDMMVRDNAKYDMKSRDNVLYINKLIGRHMSYAANKRAIAKEHSIAINIKKNALHLTSQSHTDTRKFIKIGQSIKDVRQGVWKIHTDQIVGGLDMLYMTHSDYSKTKISKSETLIVGTENIVFNLGVSQTDVEFTLNDVSILDTPLKVTGKSNIFADAYHKMLTDKMQIRLEYAYDERSKTDKVSSIRITLVNHGQGHTDDYDEFGSHDMRAGHTCLCHDCILFLKKQCDQRDTYERCV